MEELKMREKVVLAYSGGLDTTAIIPWLKENYDYDVVCVCANVGQGNEIDGLAERAKLSGAEKLYIEDLTDEFVDDYVLPCVQADAVYENKYLLGTSMARPVIAKRLVEIARKEGAVAICHGATGKGNDQVRFELTIKALAPDIKIIAPWRCNDTWKMQSREDEIEYCKQHGIDLPFASDSSYSRDRNLWHISHEGLELEDPANEPPEDIYAWTAGWETALDTPQKVTIEFEEGIPVAINGEMMPLIKIIEKANEIAGENGIGRVDTIENRMIGLKSREIYEVPGAKLLIAAHEYLEELVLTTDEIRFKEYMSTLYADLVYRALWQEPLREDLDQAFDQMQRRVSGEVELRLYKGSITILTRKSPYSLHSIDQITFEDKDTDQREIEGMIKYHGMQAANYQKL